MRCPQCKKGEMETYLFTSPPYENMKECVNCGYRASASRLRLIELQERRE